MNFQKLERQKYELLIAGEKHMNIQKLERKRKKSMSSFEAIKIGPLLVAM